MLATAARAAGTDAAAPCALASPLAAAPFAIAASEMEAQQAWDAASLRRHRVWITVTARNDGDQPVSVYPIREIDAGDDVARRSSRSLDGATIAAHASAVMAFSFYVPATARTIAVHMRRWTPGGAARFEVAARCSAPTWEPGTMPAPVHALLVEAMTLYAQHALVPPVDPAKSLRDALLEATGAQDAEDLEEVLRYQMFLVHDRHSYFHPPRRVGAFYAALEPRAPEVTLRADGIAVLRLRTVGSPSQETLVAYARDLHASIAAIAAQHPRGWVVDLREHGGGNMWVGLAGLSSLLDGPKVGAFVDRAGHSRAWFAERGEAGVDGVPAVATRAGEDVVFTGPVAVLIGPGTASAGEALAVAFEGRARTRFFGAPTRGDTNNGVSMYTLADGTLFGIAEVRNADRSGRTRDGAITPDVATDAAPDDPFPPREAIDWLTTQLAAPRA